MKEKGKEEGGQVFLMMACQYANVERILTIMQQWIQTKLIFAIRDICVKRGPYEY